MQSSRTPAARQWSRSPGRSQEDALRLAFTLLELLIAISIIAVMASLILTVASSASTRSKNMQVAADIQSLSAGISAFKQRFGVEPPSSIVLQEDPSTTPWDARSMGIIRQIWPLFDFYYGGTQASPNKYDISGDGNFTSIPLSGAECLVFFLGGVPALNATTGGGAPVGFSQNPASPFDRSGSNRLSFTELDRSRLYLFQPSGGTARLMNTYSDTLQHPTQPTSSVNPYLYYSSYGGQGYDIPDDVIGSPAQGSQVGVPPYTTTNPAPSPPGGTFVDIYRSGSQTYWAVTPPATPPPPPPWPATINSSSASPTSPALNTNSYQIISPGGDQQYGIGGEYETADPKGLLNGSRSVERDNITNFSSGTLAP